MREEHPNPQFKRDNFTSLNGTWQFMSEATGDKARPINVPFCPESRLSGIGFTGFINECAYVRTFETALPAAGERVVLNFGAVDHDAEVYVNGNFAGAHSGGYTPFGFDIAPLLKEGENELKVLVRDNTSANYPSGKQSSRPETYGCFYTRVTGIWQSVWLERTPSEYIKQFRFFPDVRRVSVDIELSVEGEGEAEIEVFYDGREVGRVSGLVRYRRKFSVPLKEKRLWEPGAGRLYDVKISFKGDTVTSYFGLREARYDGMRFLLNGKSVFQRFVLDQGYYPDGLYTAPDEKSLERDVRLGMSLGFNGARLHQKLFEPLFLYHCDRLGYMVWGEYASWGVKYDDLEALGAFVSEWTEAVNRDFNHPCIVTWCPLNETWENLDVPGKVRDVRFVNAVYALTKALDPTRPCVDVSGGFHGAETDLYDFHDYLDPETVRGHIKAIEDGDELVMDRIYAPDFAGETDLKYKPGIPLNASEYGGMAFSAESGGWGYSTSRSEEEFSENYIALTDLWLDCPKISGFCYTQLYDVEQEQNGLLNYDRSEKFSKDITEKIARCNKRPAAMEK